MVTKEKYVICHLDRPETIAYGNVFEEGDIWIKTRSCEDCSLTNRKKCCTGCKLFTELGCKLHLEGKGENKPFGCVVNPMPKRCMSQCCLEFKCVKGSREGQIRKVCKPGNEFD